MTWSSVAPATTSRFWRPATIRSCESRRRQRYGRRTRGADTLQFNGANDETQQHPNLRPTRPLAIGAANVGNVAMDVNGVEQVNVVALGGADTITVNDLSRTDVTQVNIDLAGTAGSGIGDGQADTVVIVGTNGNDVVSVFGDANGTTATGLAAEIHIAGTESDKDRLIVRAVAGDDVIEASGLAATGIQLTADGGDGNDDLIGGTATTRCSAARATTF